MSIEQQKKELEEAYLHCRKRWKELTPEQRSSVLNYILVLSNIGISAERGEMQATAELASLAIMMIERNV